jgi:hypothetical protein
VTRPVDERLDRAPDLAGLAGDVDDGIPVSPGDLVVGAGLVAVGPDERGTVGRAAGSAARQAGDVVAAVECRGGDAAAEPDRAAEDEDAHPLNRPHPAGRAQRGSLSA